MRSPLPYLAIVSAMFSLSPAQANQANAPAQAAPSAAMVAHGTLTPQATPQETANLSQATSRNLSCETLLETAGYQQAALQSVVERHAAAQAAGQETSELEKMVYESQARLDRTQGQINTACAA